MYTNLQPLTRQQILDTIKDRSGKDGFSIANAMAFPVIAEPGWFDPEQVKGDKTIGYPFNLGIWARQFADEVEEILGSQLFRLNLVFTYVIDNEFYRGAIWMDLPLRLDISVRVTEQRHLKIKPDRVILASIADNTEFQTWRPELSLNYTNKLYWTTQKVLQTTTYNPSEEYCPVFSGEVESAMIQWWRKAYLATLEMPGYRSPAYVDEALAELDACRVKLFTLRMEKQSLRLKKTLVTPPSVYSHFAHFVALVRGVGTSEKDVNLEELHPKVLAWVKEICNALHAQLEVAYGERRQQLLSEREA